MIHLYTRRDVLRSAGCAAGLSLSIALFGGCSTDTSGSSNAYTGGENPGGDEESVPPFEAVTITYSDTDAFMKQFNSEIESGNTVKVRFDGGDRLGEKSKLFQVMMDQSQVANCEELVEVIRKKDTRQGRDELAKIFEPELLEHEELSEPLELPSGEIVASGTVVLIIVLLFSMFVVAEVARGRRISRVTIGPGEIVFEPISA